MDVSLIVANSLYNIYYQLITFLNSINCDQSRLGIHVAKATPNQN